MSLKLLQITDTHLFETPEGEQKGVNTCETLRAVVDDVAAHHPDFDALLLTGDLSQDETPESYELLKRVLQPIRNAPMHAIPGNHDNLQYMEDHLTESERFRVGTDAAIGSWRIVMLNSQIPGRVHGEVGREQIARVREVVESTTGNIIVALHHPPVEVGTAWLDASRCHDGQELLAALASPPVKAVVCGHVHQRYEGSHQGVAVLATPSTCVQFTPGVEEFDIDDAAPGYRVFELEHDGRWSSVVRRVTA